MRQLWASGSELAEHIKPKIQFDDGIYLLI
jgi:hypothetical protein